MELRIKKLQNIEMSARGKEAWLAELVRAEDIPVSQMIVLVLLWTTYLSRPSSYILLQPSTD